jgi:hypothetical protein
MMHFIRSLFQKLRREKRAVSTAIFVDGLQAVSEVQLFADEQLTKHLGDLKVQDGGFLWLTLPDRYAYEEKVFWISYTRLDWVEKYKRWVGIQSSELRVFNYTRTAKQILEDYHQVALKP